MMPAQGHRHQRGIRHATQQTAALSSVQEPMALGKRAWFRFAWLMLGFFFTGLNRLKITGAEHVPRRGGVLFAANHLSIFDTLIIPWVNIAQVRLEVVWAPAKAEL